MEIKNKIHENLVDGDSLNFTGIIILSFIAESLWETIKMTWEHGKLSIDRIGALLCGILIAVSTNIDIISIAGISDRYHLVGVILTGVLLSRGANFTHDIVRAISNICEKSK